MRAAPSIVIGRVVKPQGRKGEVIAEVLSDQPGRFAELRHVFVGGGPAAEAREMRVSSGWPHKGRYVLKFEGVDSIEDAERLRGQELRIAEADLAPLPEGSYYHHQLLGLRVEDPGGRELGTVTGLMETGTAPVLVVRGTGEERLIPLVQSFVRQVDLAGGRLVALDAQPEK